MPQTVLDTLFGQYVLTCQVRPVMVAPDELVHVVGAQEPVRDQPDVRARMLLTMNWLKVEYVRVDLPDNKRLEQVMALQKAARAALRQSADSATPPLIPIEQPAEREQVRWLVEKTRPHESKQQIAQRVWLAMVLHSLGFRGMKFDDEGQIFWDGGGMAGRIGLAPDALLDVAWPQTAHQSYAASFRQPDGAITRGKGRQRWHVYRLTIDPAADPLFARRAAPVQEKVALIVASDMRATQPQLPLNFYGGDAFQQACIDAQDQPFDHMLVLSPQHGVISLDDTVPADQSWEEVIDRRIWSWQLQTTQRLGAQLFGDPTVEVPQGTEVNWWHWLNPDSRYDLTIFGSGFPIRLMLDHIVQSSARARDHWPVIAIAEWRAGYNAGDYDEDLSDMGGFSGLGLDLDDDFDDDLDIQAVMQDIDQLLEWATEFVALVNIFIAPTGETWELAPDEALVPIRLLTEIGMDIEDLLDLLTDITLLLEQSLPISLLINANMVVSVLLQITHSLAHNERGPIAEILSVFPEDTLRHYIETAMQEPNLEDQLCACLTLAEQMQLIAMALPSDLVDQLLIWLQTHISVQMRQRLLNDDTDVTMI
ncbi:MAG: hypothetical protein JXA10_16170 [Anaerolineae bacterium]|nr:hypothetical protein [Anaerolineae bacterium]